MDSKSTYDDSLSDVSYSEDDILNRSLDFEVENKLETIT